MEKLNAVNDDWELGLPNADDLTPLSHNLISPGLMSAFNIKPTPPRSPSDVTDASRATLSGIFSGAGNFSGTGDRDVTGDGDVSGGEVAGGGVDEGSEAKKPGRRNVSPEDADSKRVRLVWTPQLHRRFVDVVAHLGIKNAVPKTIMQLMNVEGLTRENVASHLQKYRLYLKRNQHGGGGGGVDFEPGPTPVQQQICGYGGGGGGVGYNNSNNYGNHNYQYGNGVMQTGNNNMFGYHHNHPNHGFAPHVAPGEK